MSDGPGIVFRVQLRSTALSQPTQRRQKVVETSYFWSQKRLRLV